MTRSGEELERDIEAARNRLGEDLDELQRRITPGQLVDQLADYAREGPASEFAINLGREIRQNPLPLLLTAAGIAWLIFATERSRARALRAGRALPVPRPTAPVPAPVISRHSREEKHPVPAE